MVTDPGDVPDVLGEVDVVFPVMHGPWGQDGTLQGLLEMADVRYVGAGVLSSAVGTDKHFMKQLFMAAGLPVLPYVLVRPRQWEQDPAAIREAVEALDYPVFVKPARAGSSFGISRVDDADGLDAAIEDARRFDPKVIVEAAATNAREVEIGVLQGLDGGAPGDQRDRGDHGGPGAHVLRLRGEVPRAELPHPGLAQRGGRRAGARISPYAPSRPSTSRAWHGSTSS